MARDEIRVFLSYVWFTALHQVMDIFNLTPSDHLHGAKRRMGEESNELMNLSKKLDISGDARTPENSNLQTEDEVALLKRFFQNLGDDVDSAELRKKMLEQYANVYENTKRDRSILTGSTLSSTLLPSQNGVKLQNTPDHISEHTVPDRIMRSSESLGIDESGQHGGLLGNSPSTVIAGMKERDWIMKHRHAKLSVKQNKRHRNSVMNLPTRIQALLDVCFPSKPLQGEVLPIFDMCHNSSFNFRSLEMSQRRYFSFRLEAQFLLRVCEKYATYIDSEDVHWTLVFANSIFSGGFSETLVQALYLCQIIKTMSFSNTSARKHQAFSINSQGYGDDDCATLLANLAGSLPPWVTCLTFDNIMTRRSLDALVTILEKTDVQIGAFHQGAFHGLAIQNSPHIGEKAFGPLFNLLGKHNGMLQNSLDQPSLMSLKLLDLSGNKLGDQSIATVLSIVHRKNSKCSLERLDVSGNNIVEGEKVKRVF